MRSLRRSAETPLRRLARTRILVRDRPAFAQGLRRDGRAAAQLAAEYSGNRYPGLRSAAHRLFSSLTPGYRYVAPTALRMAAREGSLSRLQFFMRRRSVVEDNAIMNEDKNRKRARDTRWIAFQSLLTGIVILGVLGLFCFMFYEDGDRSHSGPYLVGKGLAFFVLAVCWGLWMIVRGIIYLVRSLSGNEHYAKSVVDAMDKFEKQHEAEMKRKVAKGSMYNVVVLLFWIFLFLAVVGAIVFGYLIWTRPR